MCGEQLVCRVKFNATEFLKVCTPSIALVYVYFELIAGSTNLPLKYTGIRPKAIKQKKNQQTYKKKKGERQRRFWGKELQSLNWRRKKIFCVERNKKSSIHLSWLAFDFYSLSHAFVPFFLLFFYFLFESNHLNYSPLN